MIGLTTSTQTIAESASREAAWYRAGLAAALIVTASLKLWLWTRAYGFEQGDPLEYINMAHAIAYQTGEEWWDIRPLLFPVMLVPVIWLGDWLPDPTGEATVMAIRLVPLTMSIASMVVVAGIGRRLGGRVVGVMAAALLGVNGVTNQLSVTPFAEVPSTLFMLVTLLLLLRTSISARADLGAGLAVGTACLIRYQSLAYLAPFVLWVLWSRRLRGSAWFLGGVAICLAGQAVLESLAYGQPFHSLIESAKYNVTSDESAQFFGAEPPWWFLTTVDRWLGVPLAGFALLGFVHGLRSSDRRAGWLLVVAAAATMLVWLSALSHKELRFASQIVPLFCVAAAQGIVAAGAVMGRRSGVVAALLLCVNLVHGIRSSLELTVAFNTGFVDGPKRVALEQPGGTLASIPWFIARPYTAGKIHLVRGDVDLWRDREAIVDTFERADYILLREYDFAADREIARLVDSQFRTIEEYPEQVVLLRNRRLGEPERPARGRR